MNRAAAKRAERVLWAGVVAGVGLAVATLRSSPKATTVPRGAAATVNGQPIPMADYAVAVETLGADLGRPRDDGLKRQALERLIDEELMLEQGLALELPRRDGATRQALCDAVFMSERAPAEANEPTDEELSRFYESEIRKSSPGAPPLSEVRAHAVALYRRKAADDAFAARLAALKKQADIRIATPLR